MPRPFSFVRLLALIVTMAFRFETANERWSHYKESVMEHPQYSPGTGEYWPNVPQKDIDYFRRNMEHGEYAQNAQSIQEQQQEQQYLQYERDRITEMVNSVPLNNIEQLVDVLENSGLLPDGSENNPYRTPDNLPEWYG